MDFSLNIEAGGNTEIRFQLGAYLIKQLHDKIEEIEKRYGPDRDVGPVTIVCDGESVEVLIGTQKQGDVECCLDEFENLVELG